MGHTLLEWVDQEKKSRRIRAAANGGGNKQTTKPKVPGEMVKPTTPTPGLAAPGAPGTGKLPNQMTPTPAIGEPVDPNQAAPPLPPIDPSQPVNVQPYPPTPQAQVMPGQKPPVKPGVSQYPGASAQQPPVPGQPPAKAAAPKPPKGKVAKPGEEEEQDPNDPAQAQGPAGAAANHVANHVQDPLGSTHTMFQNLGQKQLEYEMEKENARRSLAPVKAVLQHVDQLHQLTPQMPGMMNPDEAMGYQDPNNPMGNNQPNMAGMPGQMPGQAGGQGPGMPPKPGGLNTKNPAAGGGGSMMPGAMPGADPKAGGAKPPKAGGAKPPGGGEGGEPGAKGAAGKKGKKISMTVEGAYDPMAIRRAPSLKNMVAAADLGVTNGSTKTVRRGLSDR